MLSSVAPKIADWFVEADLSSVIISILVINAVSLSFLIGFVFTILRQPDVWLNKATQSPVLAKTFKTMGVDLEELNESDDDDFEGELNLARSPNKKTENLEELPKLPVACGEGETRALLI